MTRLRIGILCYPTSGGSGVVAFELGAGLAARGHDVHVFSYRRPFRMGRIPAGLRYHEIRIPEYPLFEYPSYGMAAACALAGTVRASGLDVLHAHYAYPHAVSAFLACRMLGEGAPKTVTTLHGTDIALVGRDSSFACLTRFGILQSDAVTAVSGFLRDRTQSLFDVRKPIQVIPNFVDAARFRPAARRAPGPPVIVHVSNFRPVKRSADALRAFHLIRGHRPAKLLFLGDGPERPAVEALARRLRLSGNVEFRGEHRDIHAVLPRASLLLTTSEFEGFGLAPLEAMACGVPVVATDAGGLPEVVHDGVTGSLVPVGDVEAAARRALEILEDPALSKRLAEAGRSRALAEFEAARVVPRYERMYQELVLRRTEALHA